MFKKVGDPGPTSLSGDYILVVVVVKASTVPAPIKDAASIQKLFFEHTHYDAFYQKSFTHL